MRNRKLYKLIAVVTALGMIAAMPMTAFAETVEQVTVEGKGSKEVDAVSNDKAEAGVSMTDGESTLDGSVTVTGDVSVSNKNADGERYSKTNGVSIVSDGGKATVNVGGNVTADASQNNDSSPNANGISTGANSTIDVGGSVVSLAKAEGGTVQGVYSGTGDTYPEYKADIHIGKDINVSSENGTAYGVNINYNATGSTTVDGDIDASGMYAYSIYINSREDKYEAGKSIDISVGGDLKAEGTKVGNGVYVKENNKDLNITVEGDITGSSHGIFAGGNTGTAKIVSGGTVSSEDGAAIMVYKSGEDEKAPDITVWKIESNTGSLVAAYEEGEKSDTYTETVANSINYIIKADTTLNGSESSKGQIKLIGTTGKVTVGDKTYETANQNQTITINVETKRGYKSTLENKGTGELIDNGDGTYTLIIPEGGGVELSAVLEKIRSSSSGSSSGSGTSSNTWSQDSNGWMTRKPNGSYANNEWLQLNWNGQTSWYHFNSNGYADGGWFTDTDGQKYYLYNAHDGKFGYMLTGWQLIDGKWYYFNTQKIDNASIGSLVVNGKTADGYNVDANGAWIQ